MVDVESEYRQRFSIEGFVSDGLIPGKIHNFNFEQFTVSVEIPPICKKSIFERDRHPRFDEAAVPFMWDRDGSIMAVDISEIRIKLLELKISVPREVSETPHINAGLFSEEQRRVMDDYTDNLHIVTNRILHYWIRVMRWKAQSHLFEEYRGSPKRSPDGGALFNVHNQSRYYMPKISRTVSMGSNKVIEIGEFDEAGEALRIQLEPPIWSEYFSSSFREMRDGDGNAAILNLAIAAESLIRSHIEDRMPEGLPKGFADSIQRINISNILSATTKFGLPKLGELINLRLLFEMRNLVMHRGKDERIDRKIFGMCASSVRSLIKNLDSAKRC